MSLTQLPNEILLLIAKSCNSLADVNTLARLNRRLHTLLNSYLYQQDINHHNCSGWKWAIENGVESTTRKFLAEGAPADGSPALKWRPIGLAAKHGHATVVKALLDAGVSPHPTAGWWDTSSSENTQQHGNPLYIAAYRGHEAVVKLLLEKGVAGDVGIEGRTPLHIAAGAGYLSIVKLLVENGCDVSAKDEQECTPLAHAAQGNQLDVVRYLLSRGADPNVRDQQDFTPICLAAKRGALETVNCLLEHGADANPAMSAGFFMTPLSFAVENGEDEVAALLVQHMGLDERLPTDQYEQRMLLQVAAMLGLEDLARRLLAAGCPVNEFPFQFGHASPDGTPLMWAIEKGHEDLALMLLDKGADVNAETPWSCALATAVEQSNIRMANILLDRGANPNFVDSFAHNHILRLAVRSEEMFRLLLERGADPLLPGTEYKTLEKAVQSGRAGVVKMLIDEIEKRTYDQKLELLKRARAVEEEHQHGKIAKLLDDAIAKIENCRIS